jgi:hypothetical protein
MIIDAREQQRGPRGLRPDVAVGFIAGEARHGRHYVDAGSHSSDDPA